MKLHHILLFAHLAGVIVWVGGMAFAHFCLRPAALRLPPALRLSLGSGVFRRFFPIVWLAIAVIVVSGFAMLVEVGFAQAPRSWPCLPLGTGSGASDTASSCFERPRPPGRFAARPSPRP